MIRVSAMSKGRIRRSLLYVPGSSDKMLEKAAGVTADAVILDLEDSVSISEKETAREKVARQIGVVRESRKEVMVRVNGMDTAWGIRDLLAICPCRPDAVIVPKADERALIVADRILDVLERENGMNPGSISLIPLFETAYSIANPLSILQVTPRIDGLQLGAEDLTKEMEIDRTSQGEEIRYARNQVAAAGKACKLDILDTPYTGIHDLDGLRRDSITARQIGFTGKVCIHPSHISVINEVFSPSEAEIAFARGLLAAYEDGVKAGKGAVMYENKMIDAPVADRAKRVIEKAERIQHS